MNTDTTEAARRAKISAAHKGVPKSAEHRAKISAALKGKQRGPGTVPPHGTTTRYKGTTVRPPCHCVRCKKAWREYKRSLRKAGHA